MTRKMKLDSAKKRWINETKANKSDATIYNLSSQVGIFIDWCDAEADRPDTVDEIDNWILSDFKIHRREEDELADSSIYNQMSALRSFITWCESRDLLEGIAANIIMPTVEDGTRDKILERERGNDLLDNLRRYEYATFKHTTFALLWTTGVQVGTVRALDLDDYHSDEMYVEIHNRPEQGSGLKNKQGAEREINLHEEVCVVLDDYIDVHRNDVTDDYGREPLLTTENGRPHRNTIRKMVTAITRPCVYSDECPYDKDIDTCEATEFRYSARCPGSVSPHPLRRSAITNFLNDGHSKELVSDRMDVSVKILEKHYDARTKGEKRELRREIFEME